MSTGTTEGARILWLTAIALGALLLAACGREEGEAGDAPGQASAEASAAEPGDSRVDMPPEVLERHGVRVEHAEEHVLVPTLRVPAQVAFNSEGMAHVGIPVRGRVTEIRVRLGDEVAVGQSLLVVESPELGEAESEFVLRHVAALGAAPAVELARAAHERARALYEQDQGVALAEVQRREAELRVAEAALRTAESEEAAARERLRVLGLTSQAIERLAAGAGIDPRFEVCAPIAGRVIEREATLGEFVGPEREALLVLADMQKLWILADVPGGRLAELREGARARVLLGSGEEHWCEGVVSFVSPALDAATRSVRVRIEPREHHSELLPGIFAQAEIESLRGGGEPVVAVPMDALQTVAGESVVFVPVAGSMREFELRRLRCGAPVLGLVPVLEGLARGEPYVAEGSFLLKAEFLKSTIAEED
jgi:cobalt-zinc-cadmium efflux system membrane fusion protein